MVGERRYEGLLFCELKINGRICLGMGDGDAVHKHAALSFDMKRLKVSSYGKFALGRSLATPGALRALEKVKIQPLMLLQRHARGDWGVVCQEGALLNDAAVHRGGRILSAYMTTANEKIWIITEADRSVTTILLSAEY